FQAEDGIRDLIVTGVQTCALPISPICKPGYEMTPHRLPAEMAEFSRIGCASAPTSSVQARLTPHFHFPAKPTRTAMGSGTPWIRSEERRVGKEGRSWLPP